MIIIKLNGGLGNQMFQYAFGKSLAYKYGRNLLVDLSRFENSDRFYCLDLFNISSVLLEHSLDYRNSQLYLLEEDRFEFDPEALNSLNGHEFEKSIFLVTGYWQSYKYFLRIYHLIQKEFQHSYEIREEYQEVEKKIRDSESVMIHVRRGDYLYAGNLAKHGIVGIDYLTKGMNLFNYRLRHPTFFIFSDDIEWCKTNVPLYPRMVFIKQDFDNGKTSFSLMRQCKHFLISNSTFSWWAAWLAEFPEKIIISPKKWFSSGDFDTSDLIPPNWLQY